MKKKWEEPKILVQEFVANEYVAACYYLACERGSNVKVPDVSNWGKEEFGSNITHAPLGTAHTCADASANRVVTDDGNLIASANVGEYNGEQRWLNGTITKWVDNGTKGQVDVGDVVYWYTLSSDEKRRWNHYGTVRATSSSHPNHS